ncbi:hypothetical protein OSCT_2117 [Oscillochloris trichoides DG-6]|uniref:Gingipain domain-containing protein n=1 Tax=Oscillochloris trichoides DG-6 TaxID=765420 RepID=E1IFL6_9CHLR|nr:hypothetical protein OSCT_2117 [Oscillochloris trichoides DG-6]
MLWQGDHDAAVEVVAQALGKNDWLALAAPEQVTDYHVGLNEAGYYIIRDRTNQVIPSLGGNLLSTDPNAAIMVVQCLAHLARYNAVRQITPPDPLAAKLEVEIIDRAHPKQTFVVGEWMNLRIKNCTHERLKISIFDLQPDWGITQILAGAEFAAGEEQILPLQISLPADYATGVDVLKVFATLDATRLDWIEQPALDESLLHPSTCSLQLFFEDLMASLRQSALPTTFSWTTEQVELQITQTPQAPQSIWSSSSSHLDTRLVFNGIDGDTGRYALPPMRITDFMSIIHGKPLLDSLTELSAHTQLSGSAMRGLKEGVNPCDLAASGWGIIFPTYPRTDPNWEKKEREIAMIREALQPLLQLRDHQTQGRFSAWVQGRGKEFRIGVDTKRRYLERHGAGPGPVDPNKVPYYLLIVGSLSDIPYNFQSQLDVQYAVGRIHFPTLEAYANYATNVVDVEVGGMYRPRRTTFFGVANNDDTLTRRSASDLILPLADYFCVERPNWQIQKLRPDQATKATLTHLLGGAQTPAVLFTASHGMQFPQGSPRQLTHQGALLCQDWPGPYEWRDSIPQDFYFAGDDLASGADLRGLIAFFFACYGAGTPQFSGFHTKEMLAAQPFLSHLPISMLGRPHGALAVVSHVDRAWSYSFHWGSAGAQRVVFESMLMRLLDGHPLGSALEFFNQRYAELSTMLHDALEAVHNGQPYDPFDLAGIWTANNDARGYALIGDPAVTVGR